MKQHEGDVTSNKDSNTISGISKHAQESSHEKVDWDKPVILKTIINKNEVSLQMKLLIRESLEKKKINR